QAMVGEPSRRLEHVDFALGGRDFRGDVGAAREIGDVSFNVFARTISEARVNLNITRRAHASVHASSTARPFELAMAGATVVSNPYEGIERWFEPGRELVVVASADEAVEAYRELLDDPGRAGELGRAARERALDEHTYLQRARRLLELPGAAEADVSALRRIAVVPAYNEEGSVAAVVRELRAADPGLEVVVIDDGSRDRTADVAEAAGARVVRLPFNLGIGGAVQTGYRYAYEHGFDLVLRVDGDGQHDPAEAAALAAPVLEGRADVAVGSRFAGTEGYRSSRSRRLAIRLLAWTVSAAVGERVTDPTSGFQVAGR